MKVFISYIILILLIPILLKAQDDESIGYKNDVYWQGNNKHAHLLYNRAISRQSHLAWATGNHTSSPVPCGAIGPEKYLKQIKGIIDNTLIGKITKEAIYDKTNIIMVIGDGFGFNHMALPIYMRIAESDTNKTYFERIMDEGSNAIILTNPVNGLVTGSAAAATAIATGTKTLLDILGLDQNGNMLETSMELAKKNNYQTGLVTDAGITDATPAGFYAHIHNRDLENEVARQLLESNFDVIFGGAALKFIPQNTKLKDLKEFKDCNYFNRELSERTDNLNLINGFAEKGYKIIGDKSGLNNLDTNTEKVLGLFASGGLSAAIDRDDENTGEPSLVEMVQKSIQILDKDSNNFFVMIEAGRIDWEAHDNDAGAVYKAVDELNRVLKVCYEYQKRNPNTLLVFLADHETGGLNISYTKVSEENAFKKDLSNNKKWLSITDPLHFQEYEKLKSPKKSLYKIFSAAKSKEELLDLLNSNSDYKINIEDAEVIFNSLMNYKKAK